jgi:hypothetical protein
VNLAECVAFCASIDRLGLDGLAVTDIALGLGYKNLRTNSFSSRLSAARQFGLVDYRGGSCGLTPLARKILEPRDQADLRSLYRQSFLTPPLYLELTDRLGQKRIPDVPILANLLVHAYQITTTASHVAAEAFLETARLAGVLDHDRILRTEAPVTPPEPETRRAETVASVSTDSSMVASSSDVTLALRLWDEDEGKMIRVQAPESITGASFERFLQAFRLLVRIVEPSRPGSGE